MLTLFLSLSPDYLNDLQGRDDDDSSSSEEVSNTFTSVTDTPVSSILTVSVPVCLSRVSWVCLRQQIESQRDERKRESEYSYWLTTPHTRHAGAE